MDQAYLRDCGRRIPMSEEMLPEDYDVVPRMNHTCSSCGEEYAEGVACDLCSDPMLRGKSPVEGIFCDKHTSCITLGRRAAWLHPEDYEDAKGQPLPGVTPGALSCGSLVVSDPPFMASIFNDFAVQLSHIINDMIVQELNKRMVAKKPGPKRRQSKPKKDRREKRPPKAYTKAWWKSKAHVSTL